MGKGILRTWPPPPSAWTQIQLIGSDGQQRWSSADKIFRVTNVLKGTISYPLRPTPINSVSAATLGACDPSSTFVLGYVRLLSISLQPGQLSPFPGIGDWYYVSGTYLGLCSVGGDDTSAYTFTASGGVVYLEEQLAIYEIKNSVGQTYPFPPFTLEYELWIGQFPA